MEETLDVLVIGAGQGGLALGKALKDAGYSFRILEKEKRVGARWQHHYDSLTLFTPRRYSSLPGLLMEGDPAKAAGGGSPDDKSFRDGYPSKDEYAQYLETYAKTFALPIVCGAHVKKLTHEDGVFVARAGRKSYRARQAVIAVGYEKPVAPETDGSIFSIHSSEYENPGKIPEGRVLVVGAGNSGAQIAVELAKSRTVDLSYRMAPSFVSPTYLGKSFYFWMDLFRLNRFPSDTILGRFLNRDREFVVGYELLPLLLSGAVRRKAPVLRIRSGKAVFENGAAEPYDAVVFATGFSPDYSFVDISDALDATGAPSHIRGASPVPGLYFIGIKGQLGSASHNIPGVHINTPYIMERISSRRAIL